MQNNLLMTYLIAQLTTAKKQLSTIGPESDPEYLHRFRVALRRFRSVLNAYTREMYAPDAIVKSLVKVTNPLRETDVFLASLDADAYPNLYRALSKYRTKQYKKIWKPLQAERIDNALETMIRDLSAWQLNVPPKRLIKTGDHLFAQAEDLHRQLTKHSDEASIHETRLSYKRARYVLEFLHEAELTDAKKRIKKVKKVLDHFGAIQDAANQLEWLHRFCEKHPSKECNALYKARKKGLGNLKDVFKA